MAERFSPILAELESVMTATGEGLSLNGKAALGATKVAAAKSVATVRGVLMPEDDHG